MEEGIYHDTDTLPEITFMYLVAALGSKTVQEVIEHAYEEWDEGGGEGVTYSSPDDTIAVTLLKGAGVSFRFGDWGPYNLTMERAQELIAERDDPPGAAPTAKAS
ncbi:MAG TPA: hypothetical protein VM124_03515 [Candidatus Limnocylindrales bacterium]|nr:hypothetical protein [Candidatus Limnocylindrales bacterium]